MSKTSIRPSGTNRFASSEDEVPGIDIHLSSRAHALHRLLPVLKYGVTIIVTAYLTARLVM